MYGPCFKCKKIGARREHHHITYDPPEVVTLCQKPCHNKITLLNTEVAQCLNRSLSNDDRLILWEMFLNSPLNTMKIWKKGKVKNKKKKWGKIPSIKKSINNLYGL